MRPSLSSGVFSIVVILSQGPGVFDAHGRIDELYVPHVAIHVVVCDDFGVISTNISDSALLKRYA